MSSGQSIAGHVIRDVTDPWELRVLEDLQVAVWGYADREVTPGTLLRISSVTGGIVLGAYPEGGGPAVGLAFGFPALLNGQAWHHSHLLALRPDLRGSGLAVALKLAQRGRALAQGLTRMTWTFDPLLARNARLNLGKLGAVARTYHPDWYALEDTREPQVPADRLMVEWRLDTPHAERPAPEPRGERVLQAGPDGLPLTPRLDLDARTLLAEVPMGAETMPIPLKRAWRLALRETLGTYLARGHQITDLARDGGRAYYVLTPAKP